MSQLKVQRKISVALFVATLNVGISLSVATKSAAEISVALLVATLSEYRLVLRPQVCRRFPVAVLVAALKKVGTESAATILAALSVATLHFGATESAAKILAALYCSIQR